MNNLEFRAWHKLQQKMYYNVGFSMVGVQIYKDEYTPGVILLDAGKDLFEIMQWTGLLDKNGKKIFEGDILEAIGEHEEMCSCEHCFNVRKGDRVVVVWLDGGFRLYPADEYKEFDKREEQMAGTCNWCVLVSENLMSPNHEVDVSCYFKVIGDKFTTPELLDNI